MLGCAHTWTDSLRLACTFTAVAHNRSEPGCSSRPDSPETETLLAWVSSAAQGSQTEGRERERENERSARRTDGSVGSRMRV